MGSFKDNLEQVSVTFGLADMLQEPEAVTFALTKGAFKIFLASIAWYILKKHEHLPLGDLSDLDFSIGEEGRLKRLLLLLIRKLKQMNNSFVVLDRHF